MTKQLNQMTLTIKHSAVQPPGAQFTEVAATLQGHRVKG